METTTAQLEQQDKATANGPIVVTVGGREFQLRPKRFAGYLEKEKFILSRRPSAVQRLADVLSSSLDDEPKRRVANEIISESSRAQFVSFVEEAEFDASLLGLGFAMWRAARDQHPEVSSVESAMELLADASKDEARHLMRVLELVA